MVVGRFVGGNDNCLYEGRRYLLLVLFHFSGG